MKRLVRVRILIVLIALAIAPAATLPFAERIRAEWARLWEPKSAFELPLVYSDFVEVSFAIEEPEVDWNDNGSQCCAIPIDFDAERQREDLEFADSMTVETFDVQVEDSVHRISDDHRRRFLEELADIRCELTGPPAAAGLEATDETRSQACSPSVGP